MNTVNTSINNNRVYTNLLDMGIPGDIAYETAFNFGLEELAADIEENGGVTETDLEADFLGLI